MRLIRFPVSSWILPNIVTKFYQSQIPETVKIAGSPKDVTFHIGFVVFFFSNTCKYKLSSSGNDCASYRFSLSSCNKYKSVKTLWKQLPYKGFASYFSSVPGSNLLSCTILLTLRFLMSYIYGAPILDVSRSYTTTHHSR